MYYIIAAFFVFIGLLVLSVENRHFKAGYSFSFLSGVGYLLFEQSTFIGDKISILDRTFTYWDLLFTFGIGIGLPIVFQGVLWIIYRNRPKEKIGLDYDLITGVISFLHFGMSIFVGHLIASSWGVFSVAFGHLLIYTFARFIFKHVKLIGTERNNSLALIALLPIVAIGAGFENINLFDGNVMLGFFSGAVFVLINLVAGLLSEKLTTRYAVLFLSIFLFVGGGLGFLVKENFGGIETLIAGIYSIVVVVAFARSFGNPLRLINFDFNSLLFLFTGLLLLLSPFISKPDLNEGKIKTTGSEISIEKNEVLTNNGEKIEVIKIEENGIGNWNIQPDASNLTFQILSMGKPTDGRFDSFSGSIYIDSLLTKSKVEIVVNMESINTFSEGRDKSLKGADYFDINKYPKATFISDSIYFKDTSYVASGSLTMIGATLPTDINFILSKKAITDDQIEFSIWKGSFLIDRSKFGMKESKGIDNKVNLSFEIEGRE